MSIAQEWPDAPEALTADDVAERLERSALRTAKILADVRQLGDGELWEAVKRSPKFPAGLLELLAVEVQHWTS